MIELLQTRLLNEHITGELAGVRVYKIHVHDQQIRLAYEYDGPRYKLFMTV